MKSSFQAGVDTLYNKCKNCGSTPSNKTPTAIESAIGSIYTNRYNSGYNSGYSSGDSAGYTRGYNAGKSSGGLTGTVTIKTIAETGYVVNNVENTFSKANMTTVISIKDGKVVSYTPTTKTVSPEKQLCNKTRVKIISVSVS